MIQTKQTYEAPAAQTLVVQIEGCILEVSGTSNPNSWTGGQTDWFNND